MDLFAPAHIVVILLVVLLLFGPRKLPDLGRSLGEGIREFKKAMRELSSDEKPSQSSDLKKKS